MNFRHTIFALSAIWLLFGSCTREIGNEAFKNVDYSQTHGPEHGSLVIAGGALRDTAVLMEFIRLAGGENAPIVIIPTASGEENPEPESIKKYFTRFGATHVTVLHTRNPEVADREDFVSPLKEAGGVWFTGGRQWRIVDAYAGTRTEEEIRNVLKRGGVIGGSSAGATIQGTYLVRGDTRTNLIVMGDHEKGFDYLSHSAIDQHLLKRNRQFDLVEVIRKYPDLLGIGLDENTAIIVRGDSLRVLGKSYVAIYDAQRWEENSVVKDTLYPKIPNGGTFILLKEGDHFDLRTRQVTVWSGRGRAIQPVPVLD